MTSVVSTSVKWSIVAAMNATSLGTFVRERRQALRLTQRELGERINLPAARIAQIEVGKVTLPGANVRRDLAAALGVSHLDLLIAAGEITLEEIRATGVQGVVEDDPRLTLVVERLRETPIPDPLWDHLLGVIESVRQLATQPAGRG